MSLEMKKRPFKLNGSTYKIKVPNMNDEVKSTYVTVNDDPETGVPLEIFLNGFDATVYEHLTAIMIFASNDLQIVGMNARAVVDKLKGIHSPRGSHNLKGFGFSPSLAASVGFILEMHMDEKQKN